MFEELDLMIGEVMGFLHLGNALTDQNCDTVGVQTCICTKKGCDRTVNNCENTQTTCVTCLSCSCDQTCGD